MLKRKAAELVGWADASAASRFGNGFRPRKMCNFFLQGRCSKGEACTYAHYMEELDPQAAAAAFAEAAGPAPEELEEGALEAALAEAGWAEGAETEVPEEAAEEEEAGAEAAEGELEAAASASICPSALQGPREFSPESMPKQLCPFWMHHPACCEQGDACPMAHGLAELGLEFGDPVEIRTDGVPPDQHPSSGSGGLNGRSMTAVKRTTSWASSNAPASWASSNVPAGVASTMALTMGEDGGGKGKGWGPRATYPGAAYPGGDWAANAAGGMGGGPSSYMPGSGPNRFAGSNFMPMKVCQFWIKDPLSCTKGMNCSFAHGVHELQPSAVATCGVSRFQHGRQPTKYCTFFANGTCTRGLSCTFAHSAEELQGGG